MKTCLVFDHDYSFAEAMAAHLRDIGFIVDSVGSAKQAQEHNASFQYNLAIIAHGNDRATELNDFKWVKNRGELTVLLSRHERMPDNLTDQALEEGFDLVIPFQGFSSIATQIMNIVSICTRCGNKKKLAGVPLGADVYLDTRKQILAHISNSGEIKEVGLTQNETDILTLFAKSRNQPVTRNALNQLWSGATNNAIDTQMTRIRKKLLDIGSQLVIRSIYGKGFLLGADTRIGPPRELVRFSPPLRLNSTSDE